MRWTLKPPPNAKTVDALANALGIDKELSALLAQRGIETFEQAKAFFRPELEDIPDPMLMADMQKAVDRVEKAISQNETILVYGDYDVDGVTSICLMTKFLKTLHPSVLWYTPDRYAEGYGVSTKGIDFAKSHNASLIIAIDCGIRSVDKVAYAKSLGIDFIICDHHLPGSVLPAAEAVLDPKRADCNYPYKDLCGCGVAFKLLQAMSSLRKIDKITTYGYLDLVATAISADIMPITGENRIMMYHGLKILRENPRPGLKALLSDIKTTVEVSDIVFKVAPKLNAPGRIEHASQAVELLMEEDTPRAQERAKKITHINQNRRDLDEQTTAEALQQIIDSKQQENASTIVYNALWNKGVIGIVASRLIEKYYRPTLVFTKSGADMVASGRSIKGFDLHAALEACSENISQFGGHSHAVGLTVKASKYEDFKKHFEDVVKTTLKDEYKRPEIAIDMALTLDKITPKFIRILKQFAPFGPQNGTPIFSTGNVHDSGGAKILGVEGLHLRLTLTDDFIEPLPAIGFNMAESYELVKNAKPIQIAYSIDENTWNGKTSIQLRLRGIKEGP